MKLYRLLHLMNILVNNDKVTIKQLSEKLEVSRRTIYRDLKQIGIHWEGSPKSGNWVIKA